MRALASLLHALRRGATDTCYQHSTTAAACSAAEITAHVQEALLGARPAPVACDGAHVTNALGARRQLWTSWPGAQPPQLEQRAQRRRRASPLLQQQQLQQQPPWWRCDARPRPTVLDQRQQARALASAAAAAADRDALIDARLRALSGEHASLERQLHDGSVAPSSARYQQLSRRAGLLATVAEGYARIARLQEELAGAEELLASEGSEELRDLAREERAALERQISEQRDSLVAHLLPPDEDDERNAVLEVRSGVGGEWAADFARDLLEMYKAYAAMQGWQFELLSVTYNDHGGVKAADALISGDAVFGRLRWESGVHRAQAVPFTEKAGRTQTGTATVAVLAEASEADVSIAEADLKWDTFRASGAGGQHVNTTDSAVRVTHVPTGVVVACQSERSQHQNRAKALRLLRSKVQEAERAKVAAAASAARQQAHGGGRFNERIRTFQYVDGRVTDHRAPGATVMGGVDRVLSGDELGGLIDAVARQRREEALDELLARQRGGGGEGEGEGEAAGSPAAAAAG